MSSLEHCILEAVRKLPPGKQQEILNHAQKLRNQPEPKKARPSGKGLWSDLNITLTAQDIDENQRDLWRDFPCNI